MPASLLYLLQANGALLLFYLGYRLVLRRLTFYDLNRAYLLFAVAFAALYPVVDISSWLTQPVVSLPATRVLSAAWEMVPPPAAPSAPDYWAVVRWAYWAGVALLGLRLLAQLMALRRIHRASWPAQWRGQAYREVGGTVSPFSFGWAIYLNPNQYAAAELSAILYHERVHVRQWHTVDTVVAQLLQVFCWFNPAAWLLRRAVQENLEFITDQQVLRANVLDAKAYQYSLVRLSTLGTGTGLATHFTFLTLKNRIAMLNKKHSATAYLGCYALLVPSLALLLLACSSPEVDPAGHRAETVAASWAASNTGNDSTLFFLDGKLSDEATLRAIPAQDISVRLGMYHKKILQRYGNQFKRADIVMTKAGEYSAEAEAFRQEYGLKTRAEMDRWEAERPKREAAEREEIRRRDSTFRLLPPPLYVLNGSPTTEEKVGELDYATVEHVRVLKGKEATARYGEKGRHDVVLVTTKQPD